MKNKIERPLFLFVVFMFSATINLCYSQVINWVFLPEGEVTGNCTSTTNLENGTVCFGLEYTPSVSGLMTSYTMGFFIECLEDFSPPVTAKSTLLSDNTQLFNTCESDGIIFLQASGQDQTPFAPVQVEANEPTIIHQVCLDYYFLDTIAIDLDDFTGISMSINGPNGPVTDYPPFDGIDIDYTGFDLRPCSGDVVCDVKLDIENGSLIIDTLSNGDIVNGSSNTQENSRIQKFDVFDEINKFCGIPGGKEDVEISISTIETFDVYGNGVLNPFIGNDLRIEQDTNGISSEIAFGQGANSVSSGGDVRGYEIKVMYEEHLRIEADQVNVLLRNPNSSNSLFESASIIFLGANELPYGKATYNGFYANGPDLSGNCNASTLGVPYDISGNGVVIVADQTRVDVTQSCLPVSGSMGVDSLLVRSVEDGGLHPEDIITGFIIRVLAEDVSQPVSLDDGSGQNGEDNIPGNLASAINTQVNMSLIGFGFDGCVFREPIRKVLEIDYTSSPEFISIGDTIRYNINVYNRGTKKLDSIDLEMILPQEIINITTSNGLEIDNNVITFDSLTLGRLDSTSMYIKGILTPTSEINDQILDVVDGGSSFKDSSDHHMFTGWEISTTQPRSGVVHWEATSDTATSVKFLYIKQAIIPTETAQLSFYHNYNTEVHKDGGRVEVSEDNGLTWSLLDTVFTQNGYPDYINSDIDFPGFSGIQSTYIESKLTLEPFKDRTIFIRFVFYSDCENSQGGWIIDDISLTGLKNGLNSNAIAMMDTLSDVDNIYPVTQVVSCTDVYSLADSGEGTLRRAIACANPIAEIQFMPLVHDKMIQLNSSIDISKHITIKVKDNNVMISQLSNDELFTISNNSSLTLEDITLLHPGQVNFNTIINNNILNLKNTTIDGKSGSIGLHIQNFGIINVDGSNLLIKEQ